MQFLVWSPVIKNTSCFAKKKFYTAYVASYFFLRNFLISQLLLLRQEIAWIRQ